MEIQNASTTPSIQNVPYDGIIDDMMSEVIAFFENDGMNITRSNF